MKLNEYWDKSHTRIPFDREHSVYAEEVVGLIPDNSVICDLGVGTGSDTIYFLSKGHTVYAYDISQYALEQLAKKAESNHYENSLKSFKKNLSSKSFSLPQNKFDLVYSRLTLHYFDSLTTINICREIYKSLKINGLAKITVKSPNDKDEMLYLKKNSRIIDIGLYNEDGLIKSRYSKKQWKKILIQANIPISEFQINDYKENLTGRKDVVKSGAKFLLNTEITIHK